MNGMNGRKILIVCLAVASFVVLSCTTRKQAVDYNNKIIEMQSQVIRSMIAFSDTFQSKDAALMETKHTQLETAIGAALASAKGMRPFEGNSQFRDAAIRLFEFYRDVTKKEYREIVDILKKTDIQEGDLKRMDDITQDISRREKGLDDDFQKVQTEFAQKYNITIIENELQKEINKM